MSARNQSPRTVRIMGSLLALVWCGAGVAAIAIAVNTSRWPLGAIGLAAVGYGVIWLQVARLGRPLTVREALMPWRGPRDSDV